MRTARRTPQNVPGGIRNPDVGPNHPDENTSARDVRDTDWSQVVALYDQFVRLDPSPIIALNGPSRSPSLTARRWHWRPSTGLRTSWPAITHHAARADPLRRLGRSQKSRAAYDKAIELAGNTAETAYLTRHRDRLR